MDSLSALSDALAGAVERAGGSIFGVNARPRLGSTGVHWRQGLVVTANHTVHLDDDIPVARPDGQIVRAGLVGRDPAIDVAVLKVETADVPVAEVADSGSVRVGHIVMALGTGPRASWGIVSAMGAERRPRHAGGDLLSLDLTLYPGFSGGPLVNTEGRVIGLITSGASRHLQLAVPAATVNRVLDDVARRGRIPQAYLGVATQHVRLPQAVRERLNLAQHTAVIVVDVQPGSPAAQGGLSIGDVIVALGGTTVSDPVDLRGALRPEHVGQRLRVSAWRGDEPREFEVVVAERPRRS